jgi:hypothetical protein
VITRAQFNDQSLKVRRGIQPLRTKALSQPLADGVTNRSAGDPVNRFAGIGDSAFHRRFRLISLQFTQDQVAGSRNVSHGGSVARTFSKYRLKSPNRPCSIEKASAGGPGLFQSGLLDLSSSG